MGKVFAYVKKWKRFPKHALLTIPGNCDSVHFFNSLGKKCSKNEAEISFHLKSKVVGDKVVGDKVVGDKVVGDNVFLISLFFVNQTQVPKDEGESPFTIFQPQIRVVKKDDTEIIP